MTVKRLRRATWTSLTVAAAVVWSGLAVGGTAEVSPSLRSLDAATTSYLLDGETTYCWGVRANVSSSDVIDELIFLRGSNADCPLKLEITLASSHLYLNENMEATWVLATAASASALFSVKDAPYLTDKRTRLRANIIHSNIHTCHFGSGCDAFRQGKSDTNATTNQIGNMSDQSSSFSSSEVKFSTPGKHVVLAHVIIPGSDLDSRYDFAVFTTVDVAVGGVATNEAGVRSNGAASSTGDEASPSPTSHGMSRNQIIVLSLVGAFLLSLLILVVAYSLKRRELSCSRRRDDSDLMTTKGSNYCVRGSNLRTRSSDWTELYAIDDMLPSSVLVDDTNTIAILRASRASTPNSTPTSQERVVADFRHDVARWDVRSSASPITPSSSAILIAAVQDPDGLSGTPASDCFVPLESLVPVSPPVNASREPSPTRWKRHFRNGGRRKHQSNSRTNQTPPDDSGDEQEVDI